MKLTRSKEMGTVFSKQLPHSSIDTRGNTGNISKITALGFGISEAFDSRRLRALFVKKSLITLKSTETG